MKMIALVVLYMGSENMFSIFIHIYILFDLFVSPSLFIHNYLLSFFFFFFFFGLGLYSLYIVMCFVLYSELYTVNLFISLNLRQPSEPPDEGLLLKSMKS